MAAAKPEVHTHLLATVHRLRKGVTLRSFSGARSHTLDSKIYISSTTAARWCVTKNARGTGGTRRYTHPCSCRALFVPRALILTRAVFSCDMSFGILCGVYDLEWSVCRRGAGEGSSPADGRGRLYIWTYHRWAPIVIDNLQIYM